MTFDLEKAREVAAFMQTYHHYGWERFYEALEEIEQMRAENKIIADRAAHNAKQDAASAKLQAARIEELKGDLETAKSSLKYDREEIKRLRAEISEQKGMIWKTQQVEKEQAARIKELESSLDEAEALTKKNADLMNAYLARIAELEDALVEGLTNFLHYRASCYDPAHRCPYAKECDDCSTWDACGHVEKFRSEARQLLQAEGKIGPDADAKPHCWRITEERKAAIKELSELLTAIGCPSCHYYIQKNYGENITVLRAMLTEADHDKP